MDKYEVIKFKDDEFEMDVRADKENDTVWLTQKEMAFLFNVSTDNVGLHIKKFLKKKSWIIQLPRNSRQLLLMVKLLKQQLMNLKLM